MEERKDEMSRRRFLGRLGLLGAVGVALPVWRLSPAVALPDEALTCDDVSGLTEQQVQTRKALKYVDQSPDPKKRCNGCQFFVKPEKEGMCGGCKLLPGPIHPQGYCTAWAAAQN